MQDLRRLAHVALLLAAVLASRGEPGIRIATWNMRNFPSGSYNLRHPDLEPGRIRQAAAVVQEIQPDVLVLQEIRDDETCQRLAAESGLTNLAVAVCSQFRDEFGVVSFQQLAILTRLPVVSAWAERWKAESNVSPPRGFVSAIVRWNGAKVAVYGVHMKSNLVIAGGEKEAQLNILRREVSARQLLAHLTHGQTNEQLRAMHAVVAGDFNTNRDNPLFVSECTLDVFEVGGFTNCFRGLAPEQRVTYLSDGRYPPATFDYVLFKGMVLGHGPKLVETSISDHAAVWVDCVPAVVEKGQGPQSRGAGD